jgi:hypothetical protein
MIPMVHLDGRVIGDGKPGRITKRLIEKFRARTQTEGIPIEDREPSTPAADGAAANDDRADRPGSAPTCQDNRFMR